MTPRGVGRVAPTALSSELPTFTGVTPHPTACTRLLDRMDICWAMHGVGRVALSPDCSFLLDTRGLVHDILVLGVGGPLRLACTL